MNTMRDGIGMSSTSLRMYFLVFGPKKNVKYATTVVNSRFSYRREGLKINNYSVVKTHKIRFEEPSAFLVLTDMKHKIYF